MNKQQLETEEYNCPNCGEVLGVFTYDENGELLDDAFDRDLAEDHHYCDIQNKRSITIKKVMTPAEAKRMYPDMVVIDEVSNITDDQMVEMIKHHNHPDQKWLVKVAPGVFQSIEDYEANHRHDEAVDNDLQDTPNINP